MSCLPSNNLARMGGLTLIEMAIVIAIIGSLIGGLLMPLTAQREYQKQKATDRQLQEVREALIGYLHINKSFPCPASATSNGQQDRLGNNNCANVNGFVPYAVLGLQGSIDNGVLVDIWQTPLRYSLTSAGTWQYAKSIPMVSASAPNLTICKATPCNIATGNIIASNIAVVIMSLGPDGPNVPATTSPHQLVNRNGGTIFITHEPMEAANVKFDDQLVWLSQAAVMYELTKTQ